MKVIFRGSILHLLLQVSIASSQNHTFALLLEEQIDMAQTLKQLKDSFNAELNVLRNGQEAILNNLDDIKATMKQLSVDNTNLQATSASRIDSIYTDIQRQIAGLSPTPPSSSFPPHDVYSLPKPALPPQTDYSDAPKRTPDSYPPAGTHP